MTDTTTAPKTEKTPITMADGRVVEFNKKQKLVKTSTIDGNTVSGQFDFVNGESRQFTISTDMLARFAAHGMEQKLGDSIAGETDIGDAILSFDDLLARLNNNEWTTTRAAGGFAGTSVLLQALMEASGKTLDEVKGFLVNKNQAEKLALRRNAKLRPIIERLEADKASKSKNTVDTDSLLQELGVEAPAGKKPKE